MNYTIATLEDVQGNMEVSFVKEGTKYILGIKNKDTTERVYRAFCSYRAAREVFKFLATAIIDGCYSFEQRKQYLVGSWETI